MTIHSKIFSGLLGMENGLEYNGFHCVINSVASQQPNDGFLYVWARAIMWAVTMVFILVCSEWTTKSLIWTFPGIKKIVSGHFDHAHQNTLTGEINPMVTLIWMTSKLLILCINKIYLNTNNKKYKLFYFDGHLLIDPWLVRGDTTNHANKRYC